MTEQTQAQPIQTSVDLDYKAVAAYQKMVPIVVGQANDCAIQNEDDYLESASVLQKIVRERDTIFNGFKSVVSQAYSLHKSLVAMRDGIIAPLNVVELEIKRRRLDYRNRMEIARQKKEEEDRRIAKDQQDARALTEAKILQDAGEPEAAAIVIEAAVTAPPPAVVVPSSVPKQQGISVRKVWKYRIDDPEKIGRPYLTPNETLINSLVSKLGKDAEKIIGGITCYQEEVEAVRRAR